MCVNPQRLETVRESVSGPVSVQISTGVVGWLRTAEGEHCDAGGAVRS